MPAEQGDAERFAAADEQGRAPYSVSDPALARDLEIAAMLRSAGGVLAPTDDERARVRARVMAGLSQGATAPLNPSPRTSFPLPADANATTVLPVVKEVPGVTGLPGVTGARDDAPTPRATATPPAARPGRRSRSGRHTLPTRPAPRTHGARRNSSPLRRALFAGAATLLAFIAVAGGSIAASRNALPGDTLYGVKRIAESVGNAVTLDQTSKAQRNLEAATTRLDEVQTLTEREPATLDPQVVRSTMQDFDTSTSDGARTLLTTPQSGNTGGLTQLHTWASDQATKLSTLRGSLPQAAQPGADQTMSLLDRLISRTESLAARTSCPDVTSGSDDLGPLPATTPCTARSSTGGQQAASSAPARSQGTPGSASVATGEPGSQPGAGAPTQDASSPPADGVPTGGTSSTATVAPSTSPTKAPSPLPGLPPIYLPPLLPGGTGITIG